MKRTYVTTISLQGKGGLEKGIYQPDGFQLSKNIETSFPIIPIIGNTIGNVEDVKIIVLRTENEDVKDNYEAFLTELEELGISKENVTKISVEENQNKTVGLTMLVRILEEIPEDSLVYADITFGTKPMSAIILSAMNCIENLKDTEVEGIFYGELPRENGKSNWDKAKLYDLTAYKYLTDVIEQLKGFEVSEPIAALKTLLNMQVNDMNKSFNEKEIWDKGEQIDEQFKNLLDVLRAMPKATKEERQYRFEWMKKQPEYNLLVKELMNNLWYSNSHESFYSRLEKRLQKVENYVFSSGEREDGIVSTRKREKDPVVFMEAVKQTIEEYTGVDTKGNVYTFLQSIGLKYNQQALKEAGKNDFQKAGFATEIDTKRLSAILKLMRRVKKICDNTNNYSNIEEILEKCILEDKKSKYTKKEIKLAKKMVEELSLDVLSIDTSVSGEDDEMGTFKDQLEDSKNAYAEIESQDILYALFDTEKNSFDEKWKLITESTGKQDREFIEAFLSKDILIALKLEAVNEEMKKKYEECLEPKCGQWCPRAKCLYDENATEAVSRKRSCFIRYGERAGVKDMGDKEVYHLLEQMGDSFYETILDNTYVQRAYIETVQNYYDLFSKKLKPAKGICDEDIFLFTDAILGNAIGKSKSSISKARNKYKEKTRPMLYQIYKDMFENLFLKE